MNFYIVVNSYNTRKIYTSIEADSYENANYLRERGERLRCTKSHMIHVQKSYIIQVQNHIRFTYRITYDSRTESHKIHVQNHILTKRIS